MASDKKESGQSDLDKVVADARRYSEQREQGYRDQALKMYPWICGRCSREFTKENVTELTVHHRDHNHDNNPSDGSNWELLCVYCHDNEHMRYAASIRGGAEPDRGRKRSSTHQPFADLASLLKRQNEPP